MHCVVSILFAALYIFNGQVLFQLLCDTYFDVLRIIDIHYPNYFDGSRTTDPLIYKVFDGLRTIDI